MTILGLNGVLFCETIRRRQNGLSYVPKKILTWMLREARGDLKARVGNRVTTRLSLHQHSFLFFSVAFNHSLVFPSRLCSKACQDILDIVGLRQAEVWRTYLNSLNSHCYSVHENKPKDNKGISKHLRSSWQQLFGLIHNIIISLKFGPNKTEIKIVAEEKGIYHHPGSNLWLAHPVTTITTPNPLSYRHCWQNNLKFC